MAWRRRSLRKFYGRYWDLTKQYEVPLSWMLHDILDDDHIQWHPPLIRHYTNFWPLLIWTLLPKSNFYLIVQGFYRTFATGVACQQRTLTHSDTWSCPCLGHACVLMSRPISPEIVLFPDFWVSNIPWYFSFAWPTVRLPHQRHIIGFCKVPVPLQQATCKSLRSNLLFTRFTYDPLHFISQWK